MLSFIFKNGGLDYFLSNILQLLPVLSSLNFQHKLSNDFQQLPSTSWLSFSKPLSKSFQVLHSATDPILLQVFIVTNTKFTVLVWKAILTKEKIPPNWVFSLVAITSNLSFFEGSVSIAIISYTVVVHQILPTCIFPILSREKPEKTFQPLAFKWLVYTILK